MQLPDLKALDKIIALCRKRGVKSIKIDNVELTLAESAPVSTYKKKAPSLTPQPDSAFETDTLSPEEMLFWSVSPMSTDEPKPE